ncbi:MAG: hypothetical protein L7H18_03110 [Candidatus Nealsonbacteria bacterium DGGOD1a]|jgi:hypothetical protein|nr:MAG: hypothetical protein L7H18_03110 [Candidatus Nealsonbacteria bacterium DGGOD1a]
MYSSQTDCGSTVSCGTDLDTGWFVKDLNDRADRIKHLEFHIEHGDYFAVLATIINIALKEKDFDREKIFKNLFDDLEYLQENYDIVKRL